PMMQTWRLAEINYGHVKASLPYEVAVLPLGATEPHNLHLPYGTDSFQVETLETHGIRKLLLLNGHGGNDLKWVLRELHRATSVHMFLCNWYKVAADGYATIFEEKDDHAGEMETSMGLAHFPELVALEQADAGSVRQSRFSAVNKG